ncbi:Protein GIGAS CELL1 [Cardamine amara subsp. amara]|uniref:Protein GIGAS CELL1 n=1 Tax=Cardamine amara subsp. amara TaxID=228776 RepID=A0ABD1B3C1_CARAN
MPEARDRVDRPVDYSAIFANRRSHGILLDEPDSRISVFQSPVQRLPSPEAGSIVRGNFSTWRPGNGRGHSPFRLSQGRENMPMVSARRGRDRPSRSVLPSWYPRTPLRDITHIIRAIERRRGAGMGVGDGLEIETPAQQQVGVLESPVPLSGEHKCSMVTPGYSVGIKRSCPPSTAKVHKMLLDITKEISEEEAGFITPEKKLLNSIDKVEKIVMEQIQILKSTPRAKREEREKRVRTLMSMR